MIHTVSPVSSWQIGDTLAGMSKAQIFPGNDTFCDIVNLELNLTSIEPAPVPLPSAFFLLGGALIGLVKIRRLKTK
jgi:hypothetical protein